MTLQELDARYFVDTDRNPPLVVEHATGNPAFAVIDGQLIAFDIWRETERPRQIGPAKPFTLQSADGSFSASIAVSNPLD